MRPGKTPSRGLRHQIIVAVIVLTALLVPSLPAGAIYNGTRDDDDAFSSVGVVFAERSGKKDAAPPDLVDGFFCNGVLIAPTIVLSMADDCFDREWIKYVWFSPVADFDPTYDRAASDDDPSNDMLDFSTADPDDTLPSWNPQASNYCRQPCYRGEVTVASSTNNRGHNQAVIRLEQPVPASIATPAALPSYNSWNLSERLGDTLTVVGYGNVRCDGGLASGDPCPVDQDDVPEDEWLEYSIIDGRFTLLHERRFTEMTVAPLTSNPREFSSGNKYIALESTGNSYPCFDAGAPAFDDDGILVGMRYRFSCSAQPGMQRVDTPNSRNFLCGGKFPELGATALCGGAAAKAVAVDGGDGQHADAQHQHNGKHMAKKGGKHKGKRRG